VTGAGSWEALLSGRELAEDPDAGVRHASDVLAALLAGPAPDELVGEAAAMAEFVSRVGAPVHARRSRRLPVLAGRTWAGRAAAAAAAAALAVIGMATASYAGVLPAPVQRLAHELFGAPAAQTGGGHHHAAPRPAPVRSAAPARLRCSWHASTVRDGGRHDTAPSCRDSRRNPARHWRSPECRPAPRHSWQPGPRRSWQPGPRRSWRPRARLAHRRCGPAAFPAQTPIHHRIRPYPTPQRTTSAPGQARYPHRPGR